MKYIRKVTALVLAIIFCTAIVIGIGVIFSVKNVNVEYVDYSGEYTAQFERTKENLNKLKGSGLMFLSDEDVCGKISDNSVIAVASYERIYPCTVNVTLKERVESFVCRNGDVYSVYDEDGGLMRTVRRENGEYINSLDLSPNVLVGTAGDAELNADDFKCVAALCNEIKNNFGSMRRLIGSITVYSSLNTADVKFRSGISIAVSDWRNSQKEKIGAAYAVYLNLSDSSRTRGVIAVTGGKDGSEAVAKYSL